MELIKITEQNGKKVVSARELHAFLEAGSNVNTWFKNQVERAMLIENEDFVCVQISESEGRGGQNKMDYAISINSAKEIAMLNGGDKGKQARLYFIECEKQLTKPMSQIDILVQSVQLLQEQSKRIDNVEAQLLEIKNKPQINAPIEHFSIMGYCRNIHKQISIEEAKTYGAKCRKMCNELGMVIGKVPDPRFGSVNTYPLDVLNQIIKN